MAENKRWPKTVPILRAGNIRLPEDPRDDPNQRSLYSWMLKTFPGDNRLIVLDEISSAAGCTLSLLMEIVSRSEQARIWNRAMRKLGYTEVV